MRKLIVLIGLVSVLVSCKDDGGTGISSLSVKKDVETAMNRTEWVSTAPNAFYSKIRFEESIIVLTRKAGGEERRGFHVTNVSTATQVVPEFIQLRIKSDRPTDELMLKKDYTELLSIIKLDPKEEEALEIPYTKLN